MANLHKAWIDTAVEKGLARFEDANVTVKDVPNKGDKQEIAFKKVVFLIDNAKQATELFTLAEAGRRTTTDDEGNEVTGSNPLASFATYAYGLECRAKVRAEFEGKFEDPDKGLKKIADMLVKTGKFKSVEKALAAARLLQESEEDSE